MPSLDTKYLASLKKHFLSYAEKRRDIIKTSDDTLHLCKRAIFAMHRDNMKEAKEKITKAEKSFKQMAKKYKNDKQATNEGAYKAALEEYVEATLLYQFLTKGKLTKITTITIPNASYVAGLCDVPGELYRYAIKSATEGNLDMVKKCAAMAQEISGSLIEFNLTKYLRNKFDQAKNAVQKIERIVYDLSLKS